MRKTQTKMKLQLSTMRNFHDILIVSGIFIFFILHTSPGTNIVNTQLPTGIQNYYGQIGSGARNKGVKGPTSSSNPSQLLTDKCHNIIVLFDKFSSLTGRL